MSNFSGSLHALCAACCFFSFSEWRTKKSPKGSGLAAALWAAIPPAAAGTAQDAAEAAQRQAFLKWTQGEALTPQEKQLVDDLWNTDPAKASEYWAAGEFLDTEVSNQKIPARQPFDERTDFYIAPNGKILAREYKNWIGTNMRDEIIKKIEDKDLYNIFNQLYRPGSIIGDGGTADVIRFEKETGLLLSKSGHRQKGIDMLKYFRKLIERKELSQSDMEVVRKIISDLENVI